MVNYQCQLTNANNVGVLVILRIGRGSGGPECDSAADQEVTATSGAIEKKVGGQVKRWSISRSIDQHERRRQCW